MDSVSSEGSAEYTEEDVVRMGSILRGNMPALHALDASNSDSDVEIMDRSNQQKKTPITKNLVAYLQTGEVHLPEANERRRLRAMAKKNIHFRMANFIIEIRMENLSCVLLSQKYRQY